MQSTRTWNCTIEVHARICDRARVPPRDVDIVGARLMYAMVVAEDVFPSDNSPMTKMEQTFADAYAFKLSIEIMIVFL
eukprot:1014484-Rhodomonas_salina.3